MNDSTIKFYDSCKINNRIITLPLTIYRDDDEIYSLQEFIAIIPRKYNNINEVDLDKLIYPEDAIYEMPQNYCAAYWTQKNGKNSKFKKINNFADAIKLLMKKKGGYEFYSRHFEKEEYITRYNINRFEDLFKRDVEYPWRVNSQRLMNFLRSGYNLKYPCYASEKIEGINFTFVAHPKIRNGIDGFTREKKSYPSQKHLFKIVKPVLKKYPGLYLIGELYNPKYKITSIYEKIKEPGNEELMFYPFDCFYVDKKRRKMRYEDRLKLVHKIINKVNSKYVVKIKSWKCNNRCEIHEHFLKILNQKGEGLVLNNINGIFYFSIGNNYIRSEDAFKYKLRADKEYKIVGFKKNKNESIIWIMEKNDGIKFNAYPVNEKIGKKDYKEQSNNFTAKDKLGVIQYDNLGPRGIPIQPIFLHVREYL